MKEHEQVHHECDCEMCARGFDCGSVTSRVAAKEAGVFPTHLHQSPEDYDAKVAARNAEELRALTTGEVEARSTRQIDFAERTGAYLARGRRRGGLWSRARVVAVSRVRPQRGSAAAARRAAGREAHPGQRGRRARRHAATTLRDDGDPPDGESDPEPEPWPWLACARLSAAEAQEAADRIAAVCGGSLTPAALRQNVEAIWPHLRGDARSAATVAVYVRLPAGLREQHDRTLRSNTKGGWR
jgi:DNA-binding transcriptional regulator YdaS (Cro superfamily)